MHFIGDCETHLCGERPAGGEAASWGSSWKFIERSPARSNAWHFKGSADPPAAAPLSSPPVDTVGKVIGDDAIVAGKRL